MAEFIKKPTPPPAPENAPSGADVFARMREVTLARADSSALVARLQEKAAGVVASKLYADPEKAGNTNSAFGKAVARAGIQRTNELLRIERLPRRDWQNAPDLAQITKEVTAALKTPGGTMELWLVQAAALRDFYDVHGLFAPVGVGAGKTLVTLLAPVVLEAQRPILLVPAALRDQTNLKVIPEMRKHWKLHRNLMVIGYEELSLAKNAELLETIQPDLIVADEVHNLKSTSAGRTRRVVRYMRAHPGTVFVALSGTITKRSLRDYHHLIAWSHKSDLMPLPSGWRELQDWADVLDEKPPENRLVSAGALKVFCGKTIDEKTKRERDETPREGYRRRLVETPGVIATSDNDLGTSLEILERPMKAPVEIIRMISQMRATWETPNGDELVEAMELWRHAREMSCGFWYRWSPAAPKPWLTARKAWNVYVRETLKTNRRGLDTPLQVWRETEASEDAPGREQWNAWVKMRDTFKPNTVPVWVDDFLLKDAAAWVESRSKAGGIVWVEFDAFGRALAERTGKPYFGGGEKASREILDVKGTIIASIRAHGTGKNLERYSENLIVSPPPTGLVWEQCLDSKTEILTEKGWWGINDPWSARMSVAAYSISDGSIRWEEGKRVERLLGDELMYGISNPHLDIRVTAGHRMVVQRIRRFGAGGVDGFDYRDREFVEAFNINGRVAIPLNGEQEAPGVPLTDSELVFIGLFMTDGNLSPGNNAISIFQSDRYPEIVNLCESVLKDCRFRFGHRVITTPTNFGERKHPLHRWTVSFGPPRNLKDRHLRGWADLVDYIDKQLPSKLEHVTKRQLLMLLYGMWAGDGDKTHGSPDYDTHSAQTLSVCSSRKSTVDRIQSLCVRRGLRCNVSEIKPGLWKMHISEDRAWSLVTMKISDGRSRWERVTSDPKERVWCASVPSGAIITRRNGKVAVVGNCLGRTHRPGQLADTVTVHTYLFNEELKASFRRARSDARYIQESLGQKQKLNIADIGFRV